MQCDAQGPLDGTISDRLDKGPSPGLAIRNRAPVDGLHRTSRQPRLEGFEKAAMSLHHQGASVACKPNMGWNSNAPAAPMAPGHTAYYSAPVPPSPGQPPHERDNDSYGHG